MEIQRILCGKYHGEENFVWEKELENQLMVVIDLVQWNKFKIDTWSWMGEETTSYTVQSCYRVQEPRVSHLEWCKDIWDLTVPGSVKVFGWRKFLNRLSSRVNLVKMEVIVSCNLCPLCSLKVKTMQHILITCEVSQCLWIKCDNWIGLTLIRNNDIVNHFCYFYVLGMSNKAICVWKSMWFALALEIWKHMNKIVFDNGQLDEVEIFVKAQWQAWSWAKFGRQRIEYSFPKWCLNPTVCLPEIHLRLSNKHKVCGLLLRYF